jgi:hypothetical protein
MKPALYWSSAVGLGFVLGLGATALMLAQAGLSGGVSVGPWQTNLAIGSTEAGLYTRAEVARRGLLALSREETMYYTATTDSEGRPLSGDCDYRLRGMDLAARWWSITAYGSDSFLIPNDAGRYSLSRTTVARKPSGQWVIDIGAEPRGRNWLPVRAGQPFDLTARFYNPEPAVHESPAEVSLPEIERVGCR